MRTLLLAAVLAVPAAAQSDPEPTAPPVTEAQSVDAALVGEWTLEEVVETGRLGEMDVEVEDMTCAFRAEGTARVEMEMVQDLDPLSHERTFSFDTEDGQILVEGDDPVGYRFLTDGRLEMTTTDGLVVRMVRARS
jgi:hypothetical protein